MCINGVARHTDFATAIRKAIADTTQSLYSISRFKKLLFLPVYVWGEREKEGGKKRVKGSRVLQQTIRCIPLLVIRGLKYASGNVTLWEAGARPRITTKSTNRDTWSVNDEEREREMLTVEQLASLLDNRLTVRSTPATSPRRAIGSPRCIIYRGWMTNEHLVNRRSRDAEDWTDGSKANEGNGRERINGVERDRAEWKTGAESDSVVGARDCLRAQYLINSAAAKGFTLETESG